MNAAADQKACGFLFADLDVAQNFFARRLVDQRSHLDAFVQAIADFDFLRACRQRIGHFLGNIAMDDQPAGRRAALPRGAKGTPQRAFDGEIEIGIFHDDLRILATEFKRHPFQILPAQ